MRGRPDYACAIIVDGAGRLLLERRFPRARHAARRLTCYGGRREGREGHEACLLRELREELAWRPRNPGPAIDLWVGERWIARFRVVRMARLPTVPRRGPGGWPTIVAVARTDHPTISRWHRAVLRAWRCGRRRVVVAR